MKEADTIDPEAVGAASKWKLSDGAPAAQFSDTKIPLNLTFSESWWSHNLEEQLEQRRKLTEYCFEKLDCQSVSFVK